MLTESAGVLTQVKAREASRAHQRGQCVNNVQPGGGMVSSDSQIKGVAEDMVAEFGENAEQEVRARCADAKARGLTLTASIWEQVLQYVKKMREDDDGNGRLQEAC